MGTTNLNGNWNGAGRIINSYPAILDDGNTVAWYDYLKLVTKDESDLVSEWGDRSGNGNSLLQATNKPLWTSNGIKFDGIDDFMKTAPFTLSQPEMFYMVVKQSSWATNDRIFDGDAGDSGTLRQIGLTPQVGLYAGSSAALNSDFTLGSYAILRILINGVSSKIQVNELTATTGDAGLSNMGGFTLGARGPGGNWADIEVKEVIIRKIADSVPDQALIYNYLKKIL